MWEWRLYIYIYFKQFLFTLSWVVIYKQYDSEKTRMLSRNWLALARTSLKIYKDHSEKNACFPLFYKFCNIGKIRLQSRRLQRNHWQQKTLFFRSFYFPFFFLMIWPFVKLWFWTFNRLFCYYYNFRYLTSIFIYYKIIYATRSNHQTLFVQIFN